MTCGTSGMKQCKHCAQVLKSKKKKTQEHWEQKQVKGS